MSDEIRTTSATGGEKGVKPERHDLLPVKGIAAIARVFGFGAQKYADHNWRRKYEWGKSIAALNRHLDAFADGETYDLCGGGCEYHSETGERTCRNHSGLPHLAHAGFHILVLLTWLEEDGEGVDNPMDDRWPSALARSQRDEIAQAQEKFAKAFVKQDGPVPAPPNSLGGSGPQAHGGLTINPVFNYQNGAPAAEDILEILRKRRNRLNS